MAEEKVVFGQSMEGLFRALDPHTPAERAAFLKYGITREAKLLPAYPLSQYVEIMDASAASRFASLPELERYAQVGQLFFSGFQRTLIGGAMVAMLKVIGPRRALQRLTRTFRTANNFTEGSVEEKAPNHHVVRVNYTERPGFYLGLLRGGCTAAGAKDLSVQLVEAKNLSATYEVRWA